MKWLLASVFLLLGSVTLAGGDFSPSDEATEEHLFVITLDGYRWQELFDGADEALISNPSCTADTAATKSLYWAADPEQRRQKLMPFFWSVIAQEGQLHGNRTFGNNVNTRNFYGISYPGYNEIFTGNPDPFIATNSRRRNPNRNVLEQLNNEPRYAGKVAAFASWDLMPYILNRKRSRFYLNAGNDLLEPEVAAEVRQTLSITGTHPRKDAPTREDAVTFLSAMDYLRRETPRVVYIGFSGTDDAAHEKSYDRYLQSAHDADRMIGDLWRFVQADPRYRGRTTFLITTDHGRGAAARNWNDHGFFVGGSTQTWMALLGAGAVPMGECRERRQLYQKQVAGTIAALMGKRDANKESLPVTFFRATETPALASR